MRRGLMAWDTNELPASALAARLVRLQEAMRAHGLDALLLYTNFPRPSAVAWVTAFTPYWADALLYVPREGEPVFATALSKRVAKWIASVKPVGELVNTPRPGKVVGERLAASGATTVGVLEFDALPGSIFDDLAAALPQARFFEGAAAFAAARHVLDDAERGLLAKADAIAVRALDAVDATLGTAGEAVGAAEKAARLAGAEEAYIHVAPDLTASPHLVRLSGTAPLGRRFALRASVAYKGVWVRRVRTCSDDPADRAADAWLARTLADISSARTIGTQLARPELVSFLAEASIGSYPLQTIATSSADAHVPDGALAVVSVRLALPGGAWLGGGPAIIGAADAFSRAA